MIKEKSKKTVIAGLLPALGIILPFVSAHGWGLPLGKLILPMHIPVLPAGFFLGPVMGFILPYLNSMVFESYCTMATGLIHKLFMILSS